MVKKRKKNPTMDTKSCLEEGSDREKFEINEEKLYSPTTLTEIELNERDKSCPLLLDKKDTKLESIHNYAQRIKSFLGWESNLDEQEFNNEHHEVTNEVVDISCLQQISHLPEDSESADEENVDCLSAVSIFENTDGKEFENIVDCMINGGNAYDFVEGNIEISDQNSEKKDIQKSEEYLIPDTVNIEIDFENNNIISNPSNGKNCSQENNIVIGDFIDVKDAIGNSKSDILSKRSGSLDSNHFSIPQEDSKINSLLVDNSEHVDVIISSDTSLETKKLSESEMNSKILPLTDRENLIDLNKRNSDTSVSCNLTCENEDKNQHYEEYINKSSETESQNSESAKKERNSYCISDMDATVRMKSFDEENFPSIYDSKTDSKGNNLDSYSESTKALSANADFEKEEYQKESSKIVVGDIITSPSEKGIALEENKTENDDPQSKKIDISEKFKNDEITEKTKRNDSDDLIIETPLGLEDNIYLKNNLPKQYVREIRRLSRDIVKDVIETARNSVHELYVNKSENFKTILQTENVKISNVADEETKPYVNQEKQRDDDEKNSKFDAKNSIEKFHSNSSYKNGQVIDGKDIKDEDTNCGFGCFYPKWIQKYATPRTYLILFSIIGIIHGCYYTYVVSILSTLEKRYAFKTKVSGVILLADEITPLILGILVGYVGGKTHRPRMVAIGMFLSATCCFVSGLPYLIYGMSKHNSSLGDGYKTGVKLCANGTNGAHCTSDEQPPTLSVIGIFLFASFLKGFATLSYYVIGFSYMDDIIKKKNSPLYFAIALALRLLGPLVGFLMSSGFLKYYENPLHDPGFGPDDPRWIGAWWMGFFLQGILLVIFTIPIALFPRRLPGQKKIEKVDVAASEDGFKEILTGLISALKRLGKNPVFIVLIINTTMKIFGHFGHAIMLPKYMENQFRLSASEASLYSGATTIVCIILSTLLGGFLIWKFTPRIKVLLGGMIASEAILCVGYLILMIPRCQTSEMLHFGTNEEGLILNSVCNNNCDCSTSSFTPFCGPDGKTLYFSPCYAGCTEEVTSLTSPKTNKIFANCSCVDQQQFGGTITEGFCPDESCRSQTIFYLVILFFLVTISNLFTVAATMILLRSVHPSDKSVALGTFETFICLFGFIPFPVTFGALVDSACLVWEKSCGETGNCWFYDMDKYGYLLHGASALFCFLSVICLIMLYFLSPRVRNLYIEEDEEEEQTKYVDIKLDTVSGSVTKL